MDLATTFADPTPSASSAVIDRVRPAARWSHSDVEAVLVAHPAIEDALVLGASDDRSDQELTALWSWVDGANEMVDDILTTLRLGDLASPISVVVVDTVPRTSDGAADYPLVCHILAVARMLGCAH